MDSGNNKASTTQHSIVFTHNSRVYTHNSRVFTHNSILEFSHDILEFPLTCILISAEQKCDCANGRQSFQISDEDVCKQEA